MQHALSTAFSSLYAPELCMIERVLNCVLPRRCVPFRGRSTSYSFRAFIIVELEFGFGPAHRGNLRPLLNRVLPLVYAIFRGP